MLSGKMVAKIHEKRLVDYRFSTENLLRNNGRKPKPVTQSLLDISSSISK